MLRVWFVFFFSFFRSSCCCILCRITVARRWLGTVVIAFHMHHDHVTKMPTKDERNNRLLTSSMCACECDYRIYRFSWCAGSSNCIDRSNRNDGFNFVFTFFSYCFRAIQSRPNRRLQREHHVVVCTYGNVGIRHQTMEKEMENVCKYAVENCMLVDCASIFLLSLSLSFRCLRSKQTARMFVSGAETIDQHTGDMWMACEEVKSFNETNKCTQTETTHKCK